MMYDCDVCKMPIHHFLSSTIRLYSFEKCSLCGDGSSHLAWESTVYFSGQEVKCHELDSKKFVEEGIASGSARCEMSQSFYASTCCITPPERPCNLCRSKSGDFFNMNSETKVSFGGEIKTCLEVYHSLYARHEQSDGHCTNTQDELFDQCCEATAAVVPGSVSGSSGVGSSNTGNGNTGAGISSQTNPNETFVENVVGEAPSTGAPGSTTAPTKKPTVGFDTWYAGALDDSPAAPAMLTSFGAYLFSMVVGLMIAVC